MKAVAVIPARWASRRFPGKPLAPIAGKPLVQHVWERCVSAGVFDAIYVATDDKRIFNAVRSFGGTPLMTSSRCGSGTERVAEVARTHRADVYVNVQGDGPFVDKKELRDCLRAIRRAKRHEIVTTAAPITTREQWEDSGVVKLVRAHDGSALYFSRAPIPACRNGGWPRGRAYAHLSVYAFKRDDLLAYCRLRPSVLEEYEKLEMLRALQAGWKYTIVMASEIHPEVDEPSDIAVVEAKLKKESHFCGRS